MTRGKGNAGKAHQILTPKSLTCFEGLKNKGENMYIDTLTYEVFGILTELDMKKCFLTLDEERQKKNSIEKRIMNCGMHRNRNVGEENKSRKQPKESCPRNKRGWREKIRL